jgi:hypothetical protein
VGASDPSTSEESTLPTTDETQGENDETPSDESGDSMSTGSTGDGDGDGDGDGEPDCGNDAEGELDDFGFTRRAPKTHELTCVDEVFNEEYTLDMPEIDYVCEMQHEGANWMLYSRATPTGCEGGGETGGAYHFCPRIWTSVEGEVAAVEGLYDYGGGHMNDFVEFVHDSTRFRAYHSSFGWGWRACQPPDCLQVLDDGNVVEDGCTPERLLPIICRRVEADGSIGELVDDFAPCEGDPNFP